MIGTRTIAGHSLPLNLLFVIVNLAGLTFTTIGFHEAFADQKWLFAGIGMTIMLLSTIGLILFKGRLMIATTARVMVGGLFIVSGLIKANDPVGFAYKLEEYFEDGALAFRIKEWFGAPGFSLEFLIDFAVAISVIICIAEIVLGVLVLIGGKIRMVSWLLLVMMLFFTFLTWHTANCDPAQKFTDRDTYSLSDPKESSLAQLKIEESKTNNDIRIISRNSEEVVVDETKKPQCVLDCGCFGDAMKGSVGRSLTPSESLWKDIVLLYLVIWIFAAQRIIQPNSIRQNWAIMPVSLVLITFFCWVFGWYFPLLFSIITLITSLWIYRSGGKLLGNHYGSALMAALWSSIFVWYVMSYDPLKDYRPYAVGKNLKAQTLDGNPGKSVMMLAYKNKKTGEVRKYDATGKEYQDSKIWEKPEWIYSQPLTTTEWIIPMRLPSITEQFNPSLDVASLTKYELAFPPVAEQMKGATVPGLKLLSGPLPEEGVPSPDMMLTIAQSEYNVESYPVDQYTILDTVDVPNPELTDVNIREYLFTADRVIVIFAKDLEGMNKGVISDLKGIAYAAKKAGVPFVFVTNSDARGIEQFRRKYGFNVPTFVNDQTELKAISRSNPCLMVLKKGTVKGKYSYRSIPSFDWIQTNLLNK